MFVEVVYLSDCQVLLGTLCRCRDVFGCLRIRVCVFVIVRHRQVVFGILLRRLYVFVIVHDHQGIVELDSAWRLSRRLQDNS